MTVHTPFEIDQQRYPARKPKRLPTAVVIQLRTAEGKVARARLVDYSRSGFGIESRAHVLIGSTIELDLPGAGWVKASVRWSLGNKSGGWFEEEIPAEAARLIAGSGED